MIMRFAAGRPWLMIAAAALLFGCEAPRSTARGVDTAAAPPRVAPAAGCRTARHYDAVGEASWYGRPYHGRRTASGRVFDMNEMTAAHRRLPFGTHVSVTNLRNARTVEVVITDRGPFVDGRIIDVSRRAAAALGFIESGVARVRVRSAGVC